MHLGGAEAEAQDGMLLQSRPRGTRWPHVSISLCCLGRMCAVGEVSRVHACTNELGTLTPAAPRIL